MEFEVLVPNNVDYEARRVAAAFEITEWKLVAAASKIERLPWQYRGGDVEWEIGIINGDVFSIQVGNRPGSSYCDLYHYHDPGDYWTVDTAGNNHDNRMVRGLYRLVFEDEGVLSQLPQLTAHEKLELRLSMPHEFWPKAWLDEEAT